MPPPVKNVERLYKEARDEMKTLVELIGQAVTRKQLTKAQGSSLLRHRQHHTQGHMLLMMKFMIEQHMTFSDAHKVAMRQVGK